MTNTQLLHSIWVSFTKPKVRWVGADLEDTFYVGITPFNCFSYSLHPVVTDLLRWSKLRAAICSEVCTNALYDINGRRWEKILYGVQLHNKLLKKHKQHLYLHCNPWALYVPSPNAKYVCGSFCCSCNKNWSTPLIWTSPVGPISGLLADAGP